MTGAAKPSGSYTELTIDKTPLLVNGFSGRDTSKVKVSVSRSQKTPSDRSAGRLSQRRSKSRTSLPRSSVGNASMTSTELETTLCSRNLAVARVACAPFTSFIARPAVGSEAKPSST